MTIFGSAGMTIFGSAGMTILGSAGIIVFGSAGGFGAMIGITILGVGCSAGGAGAGT